MDEIKLDHINLDKIENTFNGLVKEDEPVIFMKKNAESAQYSGTTSLEDIHGDHKIEKEKCIKIPLYQDQYKIMWLLPFKEFPEDIQIGEGIIETGHIDNYTTMGADYERACIKLNSLKPSLYIPERFNIELLVLSYDNGQKAVRRTDYIDSFFGKKKIDLSDKIPTSSLILGYAEPKNEPVKVPYGLDDYLMMIGE